MPYTNGEQPLLLTYDPANGQFAYLSDMSCLGLRFDDRPLWQILAEDGVTCLDTVSRMREELEHLLQAGIPEVRYVNVTLRHRQRGCTPYQAAFIFTEAGRPVTITLTERGHSSGAEGCMGLDPLTGLMDRNAFCQEVDALLRSDPEGVAAGAYAVVALDMLRFKAVNDIFGRERGDELLRQIGDVIRAQLKPQELGARLVSDYFAVLIRTEEDGPKKLLDQLQASLGKHRMPFEMTFNAGIYVTTAEVLSANSMIDRAHLALSSIKGRYDVRFAWYEEEMRSALLTEQEIEGLMASALEEKQFVVYFQPQYNHSTGMLIGAEALVRWYHPERGIVPPGDFIPIFERNGFIAKLDLYVFEQACAFLRECQDNHWALVPISVNFSRYDIFQPDFVEQLEAIRGQYDVSTRYLRVEMTETAMIEGVEYINGVIRRLHELGYVIEMDDFGSGYSSLNVLKDIDLDIIKLDMELLSDTSSTKKGGTILSSIVRMAKWLGMPVIAEGVETVEQADFLRSIGCDYMQGYLYSKPLKPQDYQKLISSSRIGAAVPQLSLVETFNAFNFWDPTSQETLIFSNYVGAAAIFGYYQGKVEVLRVNKKYLQELSMNLTEKELIESDPLAVMDEENRSRYLDMLDRATQTMEEQACETWRDITSSCCGDERFCIRSTVRVIGVSGDRYLFHAMIRNVTAEKLYYEGLLDSERRFKVASEQVNIYFWEYTIATKEMRPCFRCIRDLNLPPLVRNYPEPLIESGIFPAEIADMYRDYMRQIDEGATMPEVVVPLTQNRVPFHVRYTTEFDENGHPVKAYGSAALVVK